jgi:hypothetical protein
MENRHRNKHPPPFPPNMINRILERREREKERKSKEMREREREREGW